MSWRRVPIIWIVVLVALPARAETPVEAARALIARYDEDPARIDRARDTLESALARDSDVDAMVLLARVYFLTGDVRAKTRDEKLAAYDRGREVARRATERAPRNVDAHLWYAANTGRWGQTKGIARSLFLLSTMRQELDTILALDPRSAPGHTIQGDLFYEVPGLLGGDRAKAEQHYRTAIELDPHYTLPRIELARLLIATGRDGEARQELTRVLEERAPTSMTDWAVKDTPRARELLESLKSRR